MGLCRRTVAVLLAALPCPRQLIANHPTLALPTAPGPFAVDSVTCGERTTLPLRYRPRVRVCIYIPQKSSTKFKSPKPGDNKSQKRRAGATESNIPRSWLTQIGFQKGLARIPGALQRRSLHNFRKQCAGVWGLRTGLQSLALSLGLPPPGSGAWASLEEDFNSNLAASWAHAGLLDNPARNKNDAQSTRAELFVGLSLQAPDLSDARWGMAMAAGIRGLDFGACWRVALGRGSQVIKLIHA